MKKKILILVGLLGIIGCSSNYSKGFRMGYVRKFSQKGLLIKSWEGELLLGGIVSTGGKTPQMVNETWEFSVDPDRAHGEDIEKVVDQLTKAAESGKLTKVYYNQDTTPKIRTNTDYMAYRADIE
jgi:hypothetical protein